VLEIGCGSGKVLNTIAAHRPELTLEGCDIRPLSYSPSTFAFTQVNPDADSLPYEPGTFDAVVLFDILEHVPDPAAVLARARQVLRPDGVLVSFAPLEDQRPSFYRMYRRILGDDLYVETKEHVNAFSEAGIRRLVASGFSICDETFAYHCAGQFMDATLFALLKFPSMRARFWSSNPYYRETQADQEEDTSWFSKVLRAANAIAYWESRLLHDRRTGAAGLLLTATPAQ
jgi:SAM-dependent methyltransferase